MTSSHHLEHGRRWFDDRAWNEAYELLVAADQVTPLGAEDLERLATAAYLAGHDEESAAARSRAFQEWQHLENPGRAVRCGFWLAFSLLQRGLAAQGGGWLARTGELVEAHQLDGVEPGYLLIPSALVAMHSGNLDEALVQCERVKELAHRFADADLAGLGSIGRGEVLLRRGERAAGMREFDQAMVSVIAGETSPVVSGLIYCAVIAACHTASDLQRAEEWTAALDRWCAGQPGLVPYRGQCLVHRSQILQIRGDWKEAAGEAERARLRLSDPRHPAIGMAHYQIAELHRLRGELSAAETAYADAHAAGHDPDPGRALLLLAQNRREAAAAGIEMALSGAHDPLDRTRLLPAYVEIMLAVDRTDEAGTAVDELTELAGPADSRVLGAAADQARGALLVAEGELRPALGLLHQALATWQALDAPYHAAQARAWLATAYLQLGDGDRAELECRAAREVFKTLGAGPDLARLDRLLKESPALPVTPRELEVLRLVAAGHTNREIATTLRISQKTVERHLSNMFTKLGVANRAAATAYAYDRGLMQ